jgi:4-oxalocrotonate tautomerase
MPVVMVYMLPGRTDEQKRQLVKAMTDAMVNIARAPAENTAVLIHEVPTNDWSLNGTLVIDMKR